MSEPYWSALGGGGAVDYKGAWAAGTQYQSGDVVRLNGVDYIAVNPSLGVNPGAATGVARGEELAYVEWQYVVSSTATDEASADVVVTAPAIVFDGATRVLIEFQAAYMAPPSTNGTVVYAILFQDGVSIGLIAVVTNPGTAQNAIPIHAMRRMTPSAGSHTYSIRTYGSTGTKMVGAGPGGLGDYMPGFIRVTRA